MVYQLLSHFLRVPNILLTLPTLITPCPFNPAPICRQETCYKEEIDTLHASYRGQLQEERAHAALLESAKADAEAVWNEVLAQTEEDLEQQADRVNERLLQIKYLAGEVRLLLHVLQYNFKHIDSNV